MVGRMALSDSWEWESRTRPVLQEVFFGSLPRSDLQVQEQRADSELEGGTGSTGLASATLGWLCGCGSVSPGGRRRVCSLSAQPGYFRWLPARLIVLASGKSQLVDG